MYGKPNPLFILSNGDGIDLAVITMVKADLFLADEDDLPSVLIYFNKRDYLRYDLPDEASAIAERDRIIAARNELAKPSELPNLGIQPMPAERTHAAITAQETKC